MENDHDTKGKEMPHGRPPKKDGNRRKRRRQGKPGQKAAKNEQNPVQQAEHKRKSERNRELVIVPMVHEPVPTCALCGKPIDAIAQAICGPEPETFNHFDCVLRKIADDEHVKPHQKVSYIGRGVFAIVETDEQGRFVFVKRIPFESPEIFQSMKRYVEDHKK